MPLRNLRRFFRGNDGSDLTVTFVLVTSLFLLWGCCNGMIDVMDKHFQDLLHLTKAQSAWVQTAHYIGYALMALPAGLLARAIGYKGGIILGLMLVSAGGFWFVAATHIAAFWSFLLGVCVIAMGLTVLETVANPYTTVLGPERYGPFRINLAQSFNGIGWMLGPVIGGAFFYSADGAQAANAQLYIPYVAIAVIVLVLAGIFALARVPDLNTADRISADRAAADPAVTDWEQGSAYVREDARPGQDAVAEPSIWTQSHFVGGVIAQFAYVAAQAGIFSFFINYMISEAPPLSAFWQQSWLLHGGLTSRAGEFFISDQGAARLQGFVGFGLFTLGRLSGTVLLSRASPSRLLALYALINTALCFIVVLHLGWISVAAVFGTFFFMSITFPTVFALGIDGLGLQAKKASAFIVMAILGGAIVPKLMGHIGDIYDMSQAFWVPLGCFAVIAIYGAAWPLLSGSSQAVRVAPQTY